MVCYNLNVQLQGQRVKQLASPKTAGHRSLLLCECSLLSPLKTQEHGTQNTATQHAVEQPQLSTCSHYNVLINHSARSEHNSDVFKMLFYRLTSVAMIFQTSQVHTAVKLCHNTGLVC